MKERNHPKVAHLVLVLLGVCAFVFYSLGETSQGDIRYTISSSVDDEPVISFQQSSIDYNRRPFQVIGVYEVWPHKPHQLRTVWEVLEDPPTPKRTIETVTYSKCPEGYRVTHAPEPIATGHFYRVNMSDVFTKVKPFTYALADQGKFDTWAKESNGAITEK